MPIRNDPKSDFRYVLESDRDKPPESQPAFFFKTLSLRQFRTMGNTIAAFEDSQKNDEIFDAALKIIGDNLTAWSNITDGPGGEVLPFDSGPESLDDLLGCNEIMELALTVIHQQGSPEDKKKLSSQSTSLSASADPEHAGDREDAAENPTQ